MGIFYCPKAYLKWPEDLEWFPKYNLSRLTVTIICPKDFLDFTTIFGIHVDC